jgi:hypothetical protein
MMNHDFWWCEPVNLEYALVAHIAGRIWHVLHNVAPVTDVMYNYNVGTKPAAKLESDALLLIDWNSINL